MKIIVNNHAVGETIKFIRQWTETSQTKFGKKINLSRSAIAKIEGDINTITLNKLMEIAKNEGLIVTIEKK